MIKLKEPILINKLRLSNRLVLPPMATGKSVDGKVSPEVLEYYDEKTRGGHIGLVITEHSYVNKQGMAHSGQLSASHDSDIPGLQQLVDVIHNNSSRVICQISHAGGAANPGVTGYPAVSASPVINTRSSGGNMALPSEMSREQIDDVILSFSQAAERAKKAGFDGIEIHSAHGYLLNQFYSPLINKRTDEYNGTTLEGRLKIHRDIIQAVRNMLGTDFVVAVRLGGCDYSEGGSTLEDSAAASKILEDCGIDLLDVSGGLKGYRIPGVVGQGYFSPMTEIIKREISIPVMLTGGITTAEAAENLLNENKADLIGIGRAILKDSDWARNSML